MRRTRRPPDRPILADRDGSVMVAATLALVLLMFISVSAFLLISATVSRRASRAHRALLAMNLAEAGLVKARDELRRQGERYAGEQDTPLGQGSFTVTVRRGGDRVTIRSVGRVPDPLGPDVERTAEAAGGWRSLPDGGADVADGVWQRVPGALDIRPHPRPSEQGDAGGPAAVGRGD